jgi:hypothetical protein
MGEETVAEKEASGAPHNHRSTSPERGAAPGGIPRAANAAPTAPHQWALQFLIAVIKKSDRTKPSQQHE